MWTNMGAGLFEPYQDHRGNTDRSLQARLLLLISVRLDEFGSFFFWIDFYFCRDLSSNDLGIIKEFESFFGCLDFTCYSDWNFQSSWRLNNICSLWNKTNNFEDNSSFSQIFFYRSNTHTVFRGPGWVSWKFWATRSIFLCYRFF